MLSSVPQVIAQIGIFNITVQFILIFDFLGARIWQTYLPLLLNVTGRQDLLNKFWQDTKFQKF